MLSILDKFVLDFLFHDRSCQVNFKMFLQPYNILIGHLGDDL